MSVPLPAILVAIAEIGSRDAGNYPVILDKYKVECEEEKQKVISAGG